jgi:T5SS/PEP-CTERM-associated repeat protein
MKTKFTSQAPRTFTRNAILLAITALALCASPNSRAAAECNCVSRWTSSGGDWFNPSNWSYVVPDCGGTCVIGGSIQAEINNGGTAQISTPTPTAHACEVFLGKNSGDKGSLAVDHGTLEQCNDILVGWEGKGTLSITNGGFVHSFGTPSIASRQNSNGAVTVDGTNSQWTMGGELDVGGTISAAGGTGLLSVKNGGTVSAFNVHVYKSGTLTGNSTVTTTNGTTLEGTLKPNGTLTIGGDLTFAGTTANMQCNVALSSWDRAEVSGRATLGGRLSVTITGTFTGDFPLLHASTLVGTFSSFSATYTGCLAPSIVYDHANGYVYLHVESTCQ